MNPIYIGNSVALWAQFARMAIEAQMVIAMRTAALMGFLPQAPGENSRMVKEKQDAASEAMWAAIRAASRGERADKVLAACLKPYRRRTMANAKRLTRALTK